MREYVDNVDLPEMKDNIEIHTLPEFDIADYDLTNPKELNNYFKSIERICRNSYSYKKFISFLRDQVDMVKCSFYENVNNIDTFSIKIHIHHCPLTLYDIVTTVYAKRLCNHEPLSELMVAKETMWVHYNMMVGLIPLSETVHELVHKGMLFIPLTNVFGLYDKFVDMYGIFMDPQLKANLEQAKRFTKDYDYAKETKILEFKPVYIDPSGAYEFPNTVEIADTLSNKISAIDKGIVEKQYTLKDKEEFLKKLKN